MRAAVFHGVGSKLTIDERQRPVAEDGGLVLKVAYCGICGSDIHATERTVAPLDPETVLGHEFAGEVVESRSPDWHAGDRVIGVPLRECDECRPLGRCKKDLGILCDQNKVIGMSAALPGAYAEYVRLGAGHAIRVPGEVSFKAAALTEPLAVGAHAVRLAGSLYGRQVLVVGAGPIGLAVIALSRFAGARNVVVSEIDPTRRARAASLGASATIDPKAESVRSALDRVSGGTPEVIFECVGAQGLLRECIDLAPTHGSVVVVGVNRNEDTIVPFVAMRKELTLKFVLGYQTEDFVLVLDLMATGRIDAEALISSVVGLDDLPETFERLRRPNPDAKVLIDPSR